MAEYIQELYDTAQHIVAEADAKAKEKSKNYYDKKAKTDPLKPGEMVLVMSPEEEDSLTCRWSKW